LLAGLKLLLPVPRLGKGVTHRECLFRGHVQSEHIVHFFDDDRTRVEVVTGYVRDALARNASVLVVARDTHWRNIAAALARRGVVVGSDSRLVVLDARATLDQLMRHGRIEPALFDGTIRPLVRNLATATTAGLYAYGEMVDLLAAECDFEAAQALEACWNELAACESFTLLCGYAAAHFQAHAHREPFAAICAAHTSSRSDASDALGHWLLGSSAAS